MDPKHPNTRHFVRVISELVADYVRTHSLEECEELSRRIQRNRAIRQQLFGQPRPLSRHDPG